MSGKENADRQIRGPRSMGMKEKAGETYPQYLQVCKLERLGHNFVPRVDPLLKWFGSIPFTQRLDKVNFRLSPYYTNRLGPFVFSDGVLWKPEAN